MLLAEQFFLKLAKSALDSVFFKVHSFQPLIQVMFIHTNSGKQYK